jgi:tetratricopeptide (TPR) repeat protein
MMRRQGPGGRGRPDAPGPAEETEDQRRQRSEHLMRAAAILERLIAERPENAEFSHLLALCWREIRPARNGQAGPQRPQQRGTDRAIEILERLVKSHPDVPQYKLDLSETYAMVDALGPSARPDSTDAADQRHQQAQQRLRKAMDLSLQLAAEHPAVPEYRASRANISHRLGEILIRTRRPEQAEVSHRQAVETQTSLAREFPEVVTYQVWLMAFRNSLAKSLLMRQGGGSNIAEARELAEATVADASKLLAARPDMWYLHKLLVDANEILASAHRRQGSREEADKAGEKARRHPRELRPAEAIPPGKPLAGP